MEIDMNNIPKHIAIILDEKPYILVALSNTGVSSDYMTYFNNASDLAGKLHELYWQYAENNCRTD